MQTEIKVVDNESKVINWARLEYVAIKALKWALIVGAFFQAMHWVYDGLYWLMWEM